MNILNLEEKTKIISTLVEGNSIRATSRMTGHSKDTIIRLLITVGTACKKYQDQTLRNLSCKSIECDEIWCFCYCREKNLPEEYQGKFGYGSVWTWTSIDPDTKLVPCWLVGERTAICADKFMADLKSHLASHIELTTDGLSFYKEAVEKNFGADIDYAMLVKSFGHNDEGKDALCIEHRKIQGAPDMTSVSTSYVERQNLTMRTQIKRFTRKTNAFSKKVENLEYAVALHFMYYNFCRPHKTLNQKRNLSITPAMAANVTSKKWKIEDIVRLTNTH